MQKEIVSTLLKSQKTYNRGMIVLAGASASGKTEVAKELAKKYGITKVITTTTRNIRVGESNGKDYFFVSKERFEEMIKEGRFVEHTLYNGNYYGSTKDQIAPNKCVVIDPKGLKAYIALNDPNIVTFFLDSKEETRFARMLQRGDNPEDAKRRIEHDRTAFKPENVADVDYHADSENFNVEEVTDYVYKKYLQILASRNLAKK
jgi:guanylate kinase